MFSFDLHLQGLCAGKLIYFKAEYYGRVQYDSVFRYWSVREAMITVGGSSALHYARHTEVSCNPRTQMSVKDVIMDFEINVVIDKYVGSGVALRMSLL